MVKRKYSDDEGEFDDSFTQPVNKRIAIRTQLATPTSRPQGEMDVEMSMDAVETPSDDFTGAYPPTSQSLYPFPSKRDEMDCDDASASSPEASSYLQLSKSASDPSHVHIVENRYPSNASSIAASTLLQPRTRNSSCSCQTIPRLRLSQYGNEEGKRTMWSHCETCGAMDMVMRCDGQPVLC